MIQKKIVEFNKGKILTASMLSQIQTNAELVWRLYETYPDGIIKGFTPFEKENRIYISKGLVKYDGTVYYLDEDVCFDELIKDCDNSSESEYVMVISSDETERIAESIYSRKLAFKFVRANEYNSSSKDIPILKFVSARSKYTLFSSVDDLKKRNFNIDFFFLNYSLETGNTFNPYIFNLLKLYLEEKSNKVEMDYSILSMLYNNEAVSADILRMYIKRFGHSSYSDNLTGIELLSAFIATIDKVKEIRNEEVKAENKIKSISMGRSR